MRNSVGRPRERACVVVHLLIPRSEGRKANRKTTEDGEISEEGVEAWGGEGEAEEEEE